MSGAVVSLLIDWKPHRFFLGNRPKKHGTTMPAIMFLSHGGVKSDLGGARKIADCCPEFSPICLGILDTIQNVFSLTAQR
jgi:hypothetical protein